MSDKAILDPETKQVRLVEDLMEWATAFENRDTRRVARTALEGAEVSTVFLGLNHAFGDGPPLWFETMVFGGPLDQEMDRYETYEDALAGHAVMVERVKAVAP